MINKLKQLEKESKFTKTYDDGKSQIFTSKNKIDLTNVEFIIID